MFDIKYRPYHYLWLSIFLLAVLSSLASNKAIDIQMHDTYLVIAILHIGIIFGGIHAILGFIYWIVRFMKLITWMTYVHVITTIVISVLLILLCVLYTISNNFYLDDFSSISALTFIQIFILCQVLFLLNLILSTFKHYS